MPGRLAAFEAALHSLGGFPEQHRDVLSDVQAVAHKERHHHDMLCLRHLEAISDARFFLDEDGVYFRIESKVSDEFDLVFDGLARTFVAASAMSSDKERDFGRLGRAWKRVSLDDVPGTSQEHIRHALVSADGRAIVEDLLATP